VIDGAERDATTREAVRELGVYRDRSRADSIAALGQTLATSADQFVGGAARLVVRAPHPVSRRSWCKERPGFLLWSARADDTSRAANVARAAKVVSLIMVISISIVVYCSQEQVDDYYFVERLSISIDNHREDM
jgi:hypothetical protein